MFGRLFALVFGEALKRLAIPAACGCVLFTGLVAICGGSVYMAVPIYLGMFFVILTAWSIMAVTRGW
ncbi:MAG: hypothetical protein SFV17_12725 [Candidatus Obscuribacter sp.]|nr:hypothetical protein [Candidatus Melainabacteria bacterium]MDX1987545.1 hypothetical protein [Candidatus Obscuribacter sp.]